MRVAPLLFALFVMLPFVASAQDIKISDEKSKALNDFAYSITEVENFNSDYIAVKLIVAGRTIVNHPDLPGLDVVFYDQYLRVQERTKDSPTVYGNFWVEGDFHNPRNFNFDPSTKTLEFQHGTDEKPKTLELILTAMGIKIK